MTPTSLRRLVFPQVLQLFILSFPELKMRHSLAESADTHESPIDD